MWRRCSALLAIATASLIFVATFRGPVPASPQQQVQVAAAEQLAGAEQLQRAPLLPAVKADSGTLGAEVLKQLAAAWDAADVPIFWFFRRSRQPPTGRTAVQLLIEAATRHNATLGVVQVGACDGDWADSNDPVQPLLADVSVRASLLEPAPPLWAELRQRLMALPQAEGRLEAVNAALCPKPGTETIPFFQVSARFAAAQPKAPHWMKRQVGSLLRSHVVGHRIPEEFVEEVQVPCRTPQQLFDGGPARGSPLAGPSYVDVLLVDVEGLDAETVKAFLDVPAFQPAIIIFEHQHMGPEVLDPLLARLRRARYQYWRDNNNHVALLSGDTEMGGALFG